MKTFDFAQLGVEELTNQEMINNHGGGDSTSIGNIGGIAIGDLIDVSGNSLFNGNYALFSGNTTDVSPITSTLFNFSTSRS
ncbi:MULTISPECIES: hypothetical protein [unclassified Spirosoma]|uniref:hypothetical protein n=1 Tax=unclassified Spirosoma TaxID=2621999 RepID=UPI0009660BD1|nr:MULTISPECIES: hypothetical protein [unclassified Spirosoma]MBN8822414.1 hypothetical protein [Spirosoma sp.]OJW73720.1 MAG: hypothetical protein BGO59_18210 [Spirosoma sp. 48-14]